MPVYDNKSIKTKIETYNRINTKLQGNKMPEDSEYCACLFVISLDSIINVDEKYYLQIFSEECKYAVKKKKINSINEEINLGESDESDDDESDKSDDD